jgi:hypothetical protein
VGKTLHLPEPRVAPEELLEVEQEYLQRYFKPKQEIAPEKETRGEQTMRQAVTLYQPINRRERLMPR